MTISVVPADVWKTFLDHLLDNLAAWIVGAVMGGFGTLLAYFRLRMFKSYWEDLFGSSPNVSIVYGCTYASTITVSVDNGHQQWTPPTNVTQIAIPEGIGLGESGCLIKDRYRRDVRWVSHELYQRDDPLPALLVGGGSVNSAVADLLPLLDSGFRIRYPDHVIADSSRDLVIAPKIEDGQVTEDYGYIVAGKSPLSGARIVIVSGVLPFGSLGAQRALLNPSKQLKAALRAAIRQSGGFVAVFRFNVVRGFIPASPEIVYVRSIEAPIKN